MTAVTVVFTVVVQVPNPASGGYFNFSDVAVFFTSFALGPFAGAIAGGLGTALADVISGWAVWAPISLLAHGLEGLVAGFIAGLARRSSDSAARGGRVALAWLAASVAGSIVMIGLYLLGGSLIKGFAASVLDVPTNVIQGVVGPVLGSALAAVVHRAYPPVRELRW
jgi:uncharacterized membrane protein